MAKTKPQAKGEQSKQGSLKPVVQRELVEELRWTANLHDPICPSYSLLHRAADEIEAQRKGGKR